ncbi:hypothetical protein RRG08_046872 [Elysia crispata]|uniref:Uncharacterized protein n=1 Tax=Elysia crispata TaxID=231223 RepID=A0AAE0ZJQ8_9GAST|nr:hypothetical protein RRG08_046872 [Elysia crispata]
MYPTLRSSAGLTNAMIMPSLLEPAVFVPAAVREVYEMDIKKSNGYDINLLDTKDGRSEIKSDLYSHPHDKYSPSFSKFVSRYSPSFSKFVSRSSYDSPPTKVCSRCISCQARQSTAPYVTPRLTQSYSLCGLLTASKADKLTKDYWHVKHSPAAHQQQR